MHSEENNHGQAHHEILTGHRPNPAMAFPSVPVTDRDYYNARAAASVLSGGMSSRLFTEVREKRGLCYSVYAFHETFKTQGTMLAYAGTRAERAQETLDVTLSELKRLKDGIEDDETDRVKASAMSAPTTNAPWLRRMAHGRSPIAATAARTALMSSTPPS